MKHSRNVAGLKRWKKERRKERGREGERREGEGRAGRPRQKSPGFITRKLRNRFTQSFGRESQGFNITIGSSKEKGKIRTRKVVRLIPLSQYKDKYKEEII